MVGSLPYDADLDDEVTSRRDGCDILPKLQEGVH
jgi:hypothetical protein